MGAIITGAGGIGDLNPYIGGNGGPVVTVTAYVRLIQLQTSLGDALSAQVSYGWDQVSGAARIVQPLQGGNPDDSVTLAMGVLGSNVLQRFAGTLRENDATTFPYAVTASCKGPLYALEEFEQPKADLDDSGKPGLDFLSLTGTSYGQGASLSQIVSAVLGIVRVDTSNGNFDDPGIAYGTLAPENFTWSTGETAAAYLHRVLEATPGYRLFDSSDGNVYLRQITAVPGSTPDASFTLGQDIFGDSQSLDSSLGQRGAVLVLGYDDGSGPATATSGAGTVFRVKSNLIETDAIAQTIADYWQPIVSQRQQIVRLSTPRDELLGPGQTISVSGQLMWLKSVTTEVAANGQFTQRLVCVAGGSST